MTVPRNAPCTCGSGKRFKDCCGKLSSSRDISATSAPLAAPISDLNSVLISALAEQRAGRLAEAAGLYEKALEQSPDHPDALHMLGVVMMERGRADEAVHLILRALDVTDWRFEAFQHNFGLALGRCTNVSIASIGFSEVARAYRARTKLSGELVDQGQLVSILIPLFNHERYIERALKSVFEQTHRNIEIVLIDDGSVDDSFEIASSFAAHSPFPIRLSRRENRGAPATLNELASLAVGDWLQPLNSDDFFSPTRVSQMLACAAERNALWLFGGVVPVDDNNQPIDPLSDARVFQMRCSQSELDYSDTLSAAFLFSNPAISSGNLFVRRALFQEVHGFRDLRYHHDWDFCLRASRLFEPTYCETPSYFYRFHASNTISETNVSRPIEADTMLREHLAVVAKGEAQNPWFPNAHSWGAALYAKLLSAGLGRLLPKETLREFVAQAYEQFKLRTTT
jgi:glycosyltransferase involved in cell wall biosynthesis